MWGLQVLRCWSGFFGDHLDVSSVPSTLRSALTVVIPDNEVCCNDLEYFRHRRANDYVRKLTQKKDVYFFVEWHTSRPCSFRCSRVNRNVHSPAFLFISRLSSSLCVCGCVGGWMGVCVCVAWSVSAHNTQGQSVGQIKCLQECNIQAKILRRNRTEAVG